MVCCPLHQQKHIVQILYVVPTDHGNAPNKTWYVGSHLGRALARVTLFLVIFSVVLDHAFLSKTISEDGRWYSNPNSSTCHSVFGRLWFFAYCTFSHVQCWWRTEKLPTTTHIHHILLCHRMTENCASFHRTPFQQGMKALHHQIGTETQDRFCSECRCSTSLPESSSAILPASVQASTMCLSGTTTEVIRVSHRGLRQIRTAGFTQTRHLSHKQPIISAQKKLMHKLDRVVAAEDTGCCTWRVLWTWRSDIRGTWIS